MLVQLLVQLLVMLLPVLQQVLPAGEVRELPIFLPRASLHSSLSPMPGDRRERPRPHRSLPFTVVVVWRGLSLSISLSLFSDKHYQASIHPFQPSIFTFFDFTSLSAKHPDFSVVKSKPTSIFFPLAVAIQSHNRSRRTR